MATFNKYDCFKNDLGLKLHNLNTDVLKLAFSDTVPAGATDRVFSTDAAEISAGNGYVAGGQALSGQAWSGGVLTASADNQWDASGGDIAQFRYVILWNSTADLLIGWWDSAAEQNVTNGNSFIADNSGTLVSIS